jgi:predicted flavoprotein YhiN
LLNEVRRSKRNAECLMRDLSADQLSKLAARTKAWPFQVSGTKGFDFAQVTSGGLDTGAFDPQTLESVLVPGLFAAGEILDLDGDCGGYNLHWAWASGMAAAEGVKHRYDFT